MIPGAERRSAFSAPDFVSIWIAIPAVWSVQTPCNFIYFLWLDVANIK